MAHGIRQRGAHPKDLDCFDERELPRVRQAVADMSWLLERGYPSRRALALVGDRYALRDRQRMALQRCAAGQEESRRRRSSAVEVSALEGRTVAVDGYNVLLTLEAALSGGVLLLARDGAVRDLAAMSAHYRRVQATRPALALLKQFFERSGCCNVRWYLDRPVANSDRLRHLIEEEVRGATPPWTVELVDQVDRVLATGGDLVATADSGIIDRIDQWLNLSRAIVERSIPDAWLIDLRSETDQHAV